MPESPDCPSKEQNIRTSQFKTVGWGVVSQKHFNINIPTVCNLKPKNMWWDEIWYVVISQQYLIILYSCNACTFIFNRFYYFFVSGKTSWNRLIFWNIKPDLLRVVEVIGILEFIGRRHCNFVATYRFPKWIFKEDSKLLSSDKD